MISEKNYEQMRGAREERKEGRKVKGELKRVTPWATGTLSHQGLSERLCRKHLRIAEGQETGY